MPLRRLALGTLDLPALVLEIASEYRDLPLETLNFTQEPSSFQSEPVHSFRVADLLSCLDQLVWLQFNLGLYHREHLDTLVEVVELITDFSAIHAELDAFVKLLLE